jgi:hypothetical protein
MVREVNSLVFSIHSTTNTTNSTIHSRNNGPCITGSSNRVARRNYITVDVDYETQQGEEMDFQIYIHTKGSSNEYFLKYKEFSSNKAAFVPGLCTALHKYTSSGKTAKAVLEIKRLLVKQACLIEQDVRRRRVHKSVQARRRKEARQVEQDRLFFTERRKLPPEVLKAMNSVTARDCTFTDDVYIRVFGSSAYSHMRYYADYDMMEKFHFVTRQRRSAAHQAADLLITKFWDIMNHPNYIFVELKAGVNQLWREALNKLIHGQAHLAPAEDEWRYWLQQYSNAHTESQMRKLKHGLRVIRFHEQDLRSGIGKRMPLSLQRLRLFEALMVSERVMLDAIVWLEGEGIFVEMSNVFLFTFGVGDSEALSELFEPSGDVLKSFAKQVEIYTKLGKPFKAATRLASLLRIILEAESGVSLSTMKKATEALRCLQLLFAGVPAQIRQVQTLVSTLLKIPQAVATTPEMVDRITQHLKNTRQKLDTIWGNGKNISHSSRRRLRRCARLISGISALEIIVPSDPRFRETLQKVEKMLIELTNQAVQRELQKSRYGLAIFQTIAESMEQAVCSTSAIRSQTKWLTPACDNEASAMVLGLREERQAPCTRVFL